MNVQIAKSIVITNRETGYMIGIQKCVGNKKRKIKFLQCGKVISHPIHCRKQFPTLYEKDFT